ncbi:MAG: hypothetical protein ACKO9Q_19470, partial [Pirellula sp.]
MSRLHSFLSAGLPTSPASGLVEDPQNMHRHRDSDGVGIADAGPSISYPHRLFVPEHYESAYDYPLFVWLHSDHSSEYELDHVMHSLSLRNYVGVALRGNRLSDRSEQVFRWGSNLTDYALNEECIFHAIDEIASSMSIDRNRIFLGGFGKGATLAQWVGLRNPEQVAGVI